MLIPFFEALTETILMVILSLITSTAIALPAAYILIYAHILDNPLSKIFAKLIGNSLNFIKMAPFLLLILFIIPYLKITEYAIPSYLGAIIPLTVISTLLLTHELYVIATTKSVKILALGKKFAASPKQTILLMLLPNNFSLVSISVGKIAAQLVGYSTIIGALGFGGLGELVITEHLDNQNIFLLIACIVVIIAFNKVIDYTFNSFTKIVPKL